MDYTPAAFSDNRYPHRTTFAHEMALTVLFESGWIHFADKAESYLGLPREAKEFLQRVPTAWDDTRFVAGYPGQYTIIARRKGDTWYLAGVNGHDQTRTEQIKLGQWLPEGRYRLGLIGDGKDGRSFTFDRRQVQAGQNLSVTLLPCGGFVGTLTKD